MRKTSSPAPSHKEVGCSAAKDGGDPAASAIRRGPRRPSSSNKAGRVLGSNMSGKSVVRLIAYTQVSQNGNCSENAICLCNCLFLVCSWFLRTVLLSRFSCLNAFFKIAIVLKLFRAIDITHAWTVFHFI